jgi:tRNA(adenine34) deaminase
MNTQLDSYVDLLYQQIDIAITNDEVPVASLAFDPHGLISKHYNTTISSKNATAHSEMLCINDCCGKLQNERLTDISLLCSLEPCIMCTGAIIQARIKIVYYLCRATSGISMTDFFSGNFDENPLKEKTINHRPEIIFLEDHEERISKIMKLYFGKKRNTNGYTIY